MENNIQIKDFNNVINGYDNLLTQTNKQLILVQAVNKELQDEIKELKEKIAELEDKSNK